MYIYSIVVLTNYYKANCVVQNIFYVSVSTRCLLQCYKDVIAVVKHLVSVANIKSL